jgi:hypothetical protein
MPSNPHLSWRLHGAIGFAAFGLVVGGVRPVQAVSVNTIPFWNGVADVQTWGEGFTTSYGQTYTPESDVYLNDFSFIVAPVEEGETTNYRAYVYQWDPASGPGTNGPVGPALFQSGPLSLSSPADVFSTITIHTGSVPLAAGTPYVLFFSTLGEENLVFAENKWAWLGASNLVPNSDFVFLNSFDTFEKPWDSFFGPGYELAFSLNASSSASVPGPLPLAGAAAAFGWSRRLRCRRGVNRGPGAGSILPL